MSDHDAPEAVPEPTRELSPIPDGGLRQGMPSWLAAPPSRPMQPAGEPTPIDLGALAAEAQLPQWLKDLADRVEQGDTSDDNAGEGAPQDHPVVAPVERLDAAASSAEPAPEPPVVVPPPVEAPPVEPPLPAVATPEPRRIGVYLPLAVVAIIIAVLAAWLIWA